MRRNRILRDFQARRPANKTNETEHSIEAAFDPEEKEVKGMRERWEQYFQRLRLCSTRRTPAYVSWHVRRRRA